MAPSQLSPGQRSKWLHVTIGLTLILLSLALTVGWQYLGSPGLREGARVALQVTGSLLALALTGGLVLIFVLLLREVRLNERQSNFVSAVTHELKTPVAPLRLYLDTLEMRPLPEAQRAEFYRTMRQDLDRLNATINNVLHATMYTDRPVLDPQPLDFARLVRRAVELTRTRFQLGDEAVRAKACSRPPGRFRRTSTWPPTTQDPASRGCQGTFAFIIACGHLPRRQFRQPGTPLSRPRPGLLEPDSASSEDRSADLAIENQEGRVAPDAAF